MVNKKEGTERVYSKIDCVLGKQEGGYRKLLFSESLRPFDVGGVRLRLRKGWTIS